MVMADLFPPGRVLWAIRDGDLIPSQRLSPDSGAAADKNKVRMFEVEDVEKVFGQIIFARDMLRSVFNNSRENGLANGFFFLKFVQLAPSSSIRSCPPRAPVKSPKPSHCVFPHAFSGCLLNYDNFRVMYHYV